MMELLSPAGGYEALVAAVQSGADDIPHPRLEAVFTVDEEIGMLALSKKPLFSLKMAS